MPLTLTAPSGMNELLADVGIERDGDTSNHDHPRFVLLGHSTNPQLDLDVSVKFDLKCSKCDAFNHPQIGVGLTSRF